MSVEIYIVIGLAVVFSIGALKHLTPKERGIVIKRAVNATKYGGTATLKVAKSTVSIAYSSGQLAGIELALQGQDTLKAMDEKNQSIAMEGGAIKQALRDVNELAIKLGIENTNADLKAKVAERQALLEAMRKELV